MLASALLLIGVASLAADRPPSGEDVDELRSVVLPQTIPRDCLSLPVGQHALLVSMERLQALVRAEPGHWKTDAERVASIRADQARALIALAGSVRDASRCRVSSVAFKALPPNVLHLLVDELEAGQVACITRRSGVFRERLEVRYLGSRCGPHCGRGDILVRVPGDDQLLFAVNWWVS